MSDLQQNTSDTSSFNYKNFLLTHNQKEKLKPEYGRKLAEEFEAKYAAGVANGYTFLRNDRFKQNILWASGKQNIYKKFADQLQLNGKINFANINWKAPMLVNRIISGLVGRWMTRKEKIQVTAIDPISVNQKMEQYENAEFLLHNKKQLELLSQESGVPMVSPDEFVPEDKDDLEEWNIIGNRLPEEIKYETGTNGILEVQGFFDVMKQKLLWEAATCGLVGTYVWMDEYGVIHVEWIKSLNGVYSYSEFDDFRDTAMRGFIKSLKISDIRRKYGKQFGGKLSEEELFKIAQTCQEYQRYDKLTWNYEWLNAYVRPYDEWNCECLYFWVKSVDEESAVATITKQHKKTIIERPSEQPINLGDNQEYVKADKWNLYKGVYARESKIMLEWGLDNNMIRPQDPQESGDVEFPVSFYMYQNQDMRNVAIPEKIEEPVEGMILARLKIQQVVATMIPPGAMINLDALQEVELGMAADGNTPIDPQKVYEQTGRLYYRGRDAEGNPIPVPIQELQNTGFINAVNGLFQVYEGHYKVLKDELGEDPNMITQAMQPRVTAQNVQMSQMSADNATGYIYDAYKNIMEQTAKKIACLLNVSVRFGAKVYRNIMNEEDVANRNFSTKFQLLPDQFEIQSFEAILNQSLASNPDLVMFVDGFKLRRIARENVKLAELYYTNSLKKMRRYLQEQAQMQQEQNAQVQAAAAQQKTEGDMALKDQELQGKVALQQEQDNGAMKTTLLSSIMKIYEISAQNGAPIPSALKPLADLVLANVAIPVAQQNKQMVQGIMMQNMQQQQMAQQEAPQEQMQPEQSGQPMM
jgi:hypothetical protein